MKLIHDDSDHIVVPINPTTERNAIRSFDEIGYGVFGPSGHFLPAVFNYCTGANIAFTLKFHPELGWYIEKDKTYKRESAKVRAHKQRLERRTMKHRALLERLYEQRRESKPKSKSRQHQSDSPASRG